ncbi:hypothetical protein V6N11_054040 [Hibiscus sabdariffa]|uniref:Uncharacterized protein n=1 Tax=Hibiscus sabdariffa TaxID=183260 RepID=A0ABR2S3N1_9ROSI
MPFYAADGARKGSNNSVSFKIAEDGKDRTMHGPAYGFGRLSSSQRLEIPRPRKSKGIAIPQFVTCSGIGVV